MTKFSNQDLPVLVAGAGLAGLTAAITLARAGQRVILLEQSAQAGGRGVSRHQQDWTFNLGPHAIYRGGAGLPILKNLGIQLKGHTPVTTGAQAVIQGQLQSLTRFALSLSLKDKAGLVIWLARLMTLKSADYAHVSTASWLSPLKSQPLNQLLSFVTRVSSYCADFENLSAEVAIQQLQIALKANVLYLDGGWQTIIDQLVQQARAAGVDLRLECGLKALSRKDNHWLATTQHGPELAVSGLVLALPPQVISKLLAPWPELALHAQLSQLRPVQAACFDVGLTTLPNPKRVSAFGLDEATYLSVHSATAQLAPTKGALIHGAWYLGGPGQPENPRPLLEARLDALQPGWRELAGPIYYYPHLNVTHALATAQNGGLAGRPPLQAEGLPGVYLAGDWVGATGWLADAALASGQAAAHKLAKELAELTIRHPETVSV